MRRALITVVLAGVLDAAGRFPAWRNWRPAPSTTSAPRGIGARFIRHGPRGHESEGPRREISATSIDLLVNDGSREWAASDVAGITQRRGHAGRGALMGLAFGAGFGAFLAFTDGNCQHYGYEGCGRDDAEAAAALFLAALFGGIGGGAGAAIGAAIRPERVLYGRRVLRRRMCSNSAWRRA